MKRLISLIIVAFTGFVLFYVSRFWAFNLWDRPGLFGWKELTPKGGLVARWVRGTELAPFELLIWAIGAFLVLTVLQKMFDKLSSH